MFACTYDCAHMHAWCLWKPEECIRSPRTVVKDGCHMGVTWVPGIKFRPSTRAAIVLNHRTISNPSITCWYILLVLWCHSTTVKAGGNQLSSSTLCVPGIKLKPSGLTAITFTHCMKNGTAFCLHLPQWYLLIHFSMFLWKKKLEEMKVFCNLVMCLTIYISSSQPFPLLCMLRRENWECFLSLQCSHI